MTNGIGVLQEPIQYIKNVLSIMEGRRTNIKRMTLACSIVGTIGYSIGARMTGRWVFYSLVLLKLIVFTATNCVGNPMKQTPLWYKLSPPHSYLLEYLGLNGVNRGTQPYARARRKGVECPNF